MEESCPVLPARSVTVSHSGKEVAPPPVDFLVLDARLRPTKQRVLSPIVDAVGSVPPGWLTAAGLALGLAAAGAAAQGQWSIALVLLLANRTVDGLDGEVARANNTASDQGGYADIVVDTVVYAAIPLGAAAGSDIEHIWPITGLLLASFYVNVTTWTYLSALIEKRGAAVDSPAAGARTSVAMPAGLVEGLETAVLFALMLAFPAALDWIMGGMAVAVSVGAGWRFVSGQRRLSAADDSSERVSA